MSITTLRITITEENAGRVDLVIRDLSESSRSQVRGMFDHGCVTVNGASCGSIAVAVAIGDIVSLRYDPTQGYREKKKKWDDRTFSIAYEDEHLIVVDKAAGTLTVPTDSMHEKNTLDQRVSLYLSHSRKRREAWIVHRLDKDVSGLLVFGKLEPVAQQLIQQFKQRKPQRIYVAIVAGVMEKDDGTFDAHLATGKNLDRYVARPSSKTEAAITHYRVMQRMTNTTVVEATLETGKRNQIRVHFADAGHPVLGDPRYKKKEAQHQRWLRKRIALHARSLGFIHPVTGEEMMIESPLPSALHKFIAGSQPLKR